MIRYFCDRCKKELREENMHCVNIVVSAKDGDILKNIDGIYCNSCQLKFYDFLRKFNEMDWSML